MEGRGWIWRHGFWPLALLWLPAGIVAQAVVRFGPDVVAAGRLEPWLGDDGDGGVVARAVRALRPARAAASPTGLGQPDVALPPTRQGTVARGMRARGGQGTLTPLRQLPKR
jgi:hypothetical protein